MKNFKETFLAGFFISIPALINLIKGIILKQDGFGNKLRCKTRISLLLSLLWILPLKVIFISIWLITSPFKIISYVNDFTYDTLFN